MAMFSVRGMGVAEREAIAAMPMAMAAMDMLRSTSKVSIMPGNTVRPRSAIMGRLRRAVNSA